MILFTRTVVSPATRFSLPAKVVSGSCSASRNFGQARNVCFRSTFLILKRIMDIKRNIETARSELKNIRYIKNVATVADI